MPFILLPFTGWLLAIAGKVVGQLRQTDSAAFFERFLILWFIVVFAFFSFSGTQLPHYLLYGCTPLFILLARHRLDFERRWLAFAPVILFALLLALLPEVLAFAASKVSRPFESMLLSGLLAAFSDEARWLLPLLAIAVIGLAAWRRLPVWQGLVLAGLLQAATVTLVIAPRVIGVTQGPVREAATVAKESGLPVVAWRIIMPSFSVYRQAATPTRLPELGQLVFTRTDRKQEVQALLAPNLVLHDIYQRGFVTLARVDSVEKR
jgi:4-amino-4-deoxy-L-arabinose transferase-like glycosyltransferase